MTKREVITKAIATDGIWTDEEKEVFQKMLDQLDKKSSKPTTTPSKKKSLLEVR